MRRRRLGRADDILDGGAGSGIPDIIRYRTDKKIDILGNDTDALTKQCKGNLLYVNAVNRNGAFGNVVKTCDQIGERRFASAGFSDDAKHFSGLH
ncbi:hypothetical protein SDC9_200726 [bioreactor metagenome]|uniref:Uncharacterized protein n=1 Tax=bioreactor metagenome TaxID=1076179 RepID=A0A645J0U0_9ZZZZ